MIKLTTNFKLALTMLGLGVTLLFSACASAFGDYYDTQGHRIVPHIEAEYAIPMDGLTRGPGISSVPWSHFAWYHIIHGSRIIIYGVKDRVEQDQILARINELRTTEVLVDFYNVSRFERHTLPDGSGRAFRLDTPLLREVVVK